MIRRLAQRLSGWPRFSVLHADNKGPQSPWGGGGSGDDSGKGDDKGAGPRNPWASPPAGQRGRPGPSALDEFLKRARGTGGGGGGGGGYPDTSARATYGETYLSSGFTPDPHQVSVVAGGGLQASTVSSSCRGSIATAPDYQITYTAGSLPLAIQTRSGADTTLVVNGPDGEWYCDDDSGGGNNAQVYFSKPSSGVYDIWVGTYSGGNQSATLLITEVP